MEFETKLQTYRIEKQCDKCKTGFMICTGTGITRFDTEWEHKCDNCGNIDIYINVTYPTIEYRRIGNRKPVK